MNTSNLRLFAGTRFCHCAAALSGLALLTGCGGGGGTPAPVVTPPSVSIDVFGARGSILTAQVTVANCSSTPVVSWQTSGGALLGSGTSVRDSQPDATLIASVSCAGASASETLPPNSVYASLAAFAVLQGSSVVAWGNPVWGGQTATAAGYTNVTQVIPSERGFAVLLSDGSARAWGSAYVAVSNPSASDPGTAAIATGNLTGLSRILPGRVAYFGIGKDGSLVAWGSYRELVSGKDYSMSDASHGLTAAQLASLNNVSSIASTEGAYAALKNDGTVVAFGDPDTGGDASAVQSQLNNVVQLAGTDYDFVALRKDGSIVPWSGAFGWLTPDSSQVVSGAQSLVLNGAVGVAINGSNTAMAFGDLNSISAADSSSLNAAGLLNNVQRVYASRTAFAALKADGTVAGWGDPQRMSASLNQVQSALTGVTQIQNTDYAFAALKSNGSVVTWGDAGSGGDSSAVAAQLSNVVALTATSYSFAALRSDGSVVTWGAPDKGGDSSSVSARLTNVRAIYATAFGAFLAVRKDGSFVVWGDTWAGGSGVPATLTSIPYGK